MRYLFIAEKPSLMREVQACYKDHTAIIQQKVGLIDFVALQGHVCENFTPDDYDEWNGLKWEEIDYPIKPTVWRVKGKEEKRDVIDRIRTKVGSYDGIIVATDSDIEGYGIYFLLESYLGLQQKKAFRFIEHSLTEKEILESLLNMTDYHADPIHVAATNAYLVRSRADWLFGMNCTRIMSVKRGTKLRVGRVKAATLGIVYNNSMAIEKFKPEMYYQVCANYGKWKALLMGENGGIAQFKSKAQIGTYPLDGVVKSKKTERKQEHAPLLFDLTAIQAEAGRLFKYTPARTLELVQSLYEKHKVISYPRTQCRYVTSEKAKEFPMMIGHMSAFPDLADLAAKVTPADIQRVANDPKVVNDKEVQKESHDALLPTSTKANPATMTEEERNICHMIYARLLSQFLPQAVDNKTVLVATHGDGNFVVTGRVVVEQGWRVLYNEASDVVLPNLNEGDHVRAEKIEPVEKTTTPPKRLTQHTLIHAMQNIASVLEDKQMKASLAESKGIGTPATRAGIIKELMESGYMEDRKGGLYITQLGRTYIESLEGFDIISPVFAARLDMEMKKVQHREIDVDVAYAYIESELDEMCAKMNALERSQYQGNALAVACPFCGSVMHEQRYSYSCSSAICKFRVSREILGKRIDEKMVTALLEKRVTASYTFKSKEGKSFKARLRLGDDKKISFDFSSGISCPRCKKDVRLTKGGVFCDCGLAVYRRVNGHEFTDTELKKLLKGQKLIGIKDFISRDNKPFCANVILVDGKLKYEFEKNL